MTKYILFILLLFMISCKKENPVGSTINHDPALFGTWVINSAKVNDELIDSTEYGDIPVKIVFESNGSGILTEESGSSETVTWYTAGNTLRIDDEIDINYMVQGNSLTLSVINDTVTTTVLTYNKEVEKERDSKLFGSWILTVAKMNGEVIDSTQYGSEIPVKIIFGSDGSGTLTDVNDSLETITWYTADNQLIIDAEVEINYTVITNTLILTILDGSDLIELTYIKQ